MARTGGKPATLLSLEAMNDVFLLECLIQL